MRCVKWYGAKPKIKPATVRRALAAGQGAGEQVHGQRREDERNEQQQVVAEDEVVGEQVRMRQHRQRLEQQMIPNRPACAALDGRCWR